VNLSYTSMLCEFVSAVKIYGKKIALNNVSFGVNKNESVGLLGPNGSGKTTLLKIAATLEKPTNGQVILHKDTISRTGTIIGDYKFLKNISGKNNLDYFFNSVITDKQEAANLLNITTNLIQAFRLEDNISKKIKHLSSGTRAKLDLVSVLSKDNLLFLLDEPTTALDAQSILLLEKIINQKRQEGCAFMIASHDKTFLANCCDKVYALQDGKIVNELKSVNLL
jgi:ABC-type multidrug transport system ATPase subunit